MTFVRRLRTTAVRTPEKLPLITDAILAPVFDTAKDSHSLIAERHPVTLDGHDYEIPHFLFLGKLGGGKPLRIGIFSGFEPGLLDTVIAVSRLLLQLDINHALAEDYALFAYPVVHVRGYDTPRLPLADFQDRFARDTEDADVRLFKGDIRQWFFDGIISLHTSEVTDTLYAETSGELLGKEIVAPALRNLSRIIPVADNPVVLRPGDHRSRLKEQKSGRFLAPLDVHPRPFEIDLVAPASAPIGSRVESLYFAIIEILHRYREFIAHAPNL